ncbi:M23 family metallopeptidase [Cognatishimia sp. WU-CL00825]|uniref:M23 family metallopeptidase n=1 Tax=Cognatishimia sp. WU-CL00825 TaxID=3127658 RepID=UPI0031035F13
MRASFVSVFALAASPAASDVSLGFPVDCTLGSDCYIQNYVDIDPTQGISDFACKNLSYDGHKGTDFALFSHKDLDRAVNVLAALPGVVVGLRNDMPDHNFFDIDQSGIAGRECGNGVVLDHGDGWETQYCHLKQNSVSVSLGALVDAGQKLGEIGASGNTVFPHLHLSLRKDGNVVDPFDPTESQSCGAQSQDLWTDPIAYVGGGLIATAIDDKVPAYADLKADQNRSTEWPTNSPALVVWSFGFGLNPNDQIRFSLQYPDGETFTDIVTADRNRAQFFYAWGKRRPAGGWSAGPYIATSTMQRGSEILGYQVFEFQVN